MSILCIIYFCKYTSTSVAYSMQILINATFLSKPFQAVMVNDTGLLEISLISLKESIEKMRSAISKMFGR